MFTRRRHPGLHGNDPPQPIRPRVMNDEAFDGLTRAVGSCTSRRGALKVLLAGITGAALTPELLSACQPTHPGRVGTAAPSPSPTGTSSSPPPVSSCPPTERQRCCTAKQLKDCDHTLSNAFAAAASACSAACANRNSARCKTCVTNAARRAMAAQASCAETTCLSPPRPPSPSPSGTHTGAALQESAALETCDWKLLLDCQGNAITDLGKDLTACAVVCLVKGGAAIVECLKLCAVTGASKYDFANAVCVHKYGCSGLTFCDPSGVCCDVGFQGCSGPAGKTCCAGQEKCCGGTCCSPDIEFCCEQTCCSAEDEICCNGKCRSKCVPPFALDIDTCLCVCPGEMAECDGSCCGPNQVCNNGVCGCPTAPPNVWEPCGNACCLNPGTGPGCCNGVCCGPCQFCDDSDNLPPVCRDCTACQTCLHNGQCSPRIPYPNFQVPMIPTGVSCAGGGLCGTDGNCYCPSSCFCKEAIVTAAELDLGYRCCVMDPKTPWWTMICPPGKTCDSHHSICF